MNAVKRDRPGSELAWPEERFDKLFRDMFRDFFSRGPLTSRFFEGSPNLMHVEEFVDDATWVIRAELPGIDPEQDVEIEVSDGVLLIQAHRAERTEEERPSGYRSEFRYGSFERRIRLPEGATEADVKASYKDGILEIRVPVPPAVEKTATKVPVERS